MVIEVEQINPRHNLLVFRSRCFKNIAVGSEGIFCAKSHANTFTSSMPNVLLPLLYFSTLIPAPSTQLLRHIALLINQWLLITHNTSIFMFRDNFFFEVLIVSTTYHNSMWQAKSLLYWDTLARFALNDPCQMRSQTQGHMMMSCCHGNYGNNMAVSMKVNKQNVSPYK